MRYLVAEREVAGMLVGTVGASVTRTLDMGEVGFLCADGDEVRWHLQCPFRVVHDRAVILGSADMLYPETGDRAQAFAEQATVFDARAKLVTEILEGMSPKVVGVEVGTAGWLV
ncbi:hypothetical protein, partial [Kribbella antibiotica]|uniref:hypothetical protein n=1 Tax=Kribbella antibiotica TaxID=190195 RepID=UPI001EE1005D